MAGLLDGLGDLGLGDLEGASIFEDPAKKQAEAAAAAAPVKIKTPEEIESAIVIEKSYQCPVCDHKFKNKGLRTLTGLAKIVGSDMDLRQKYDNVDIYKYDVIMCPECGYAALAKFLKGVTDNQKKLIKEKISANFKAKEYPNPYYTYDEAIERFKMALASAVVKSARNSEKAYICLRTAWVVRGKGESLDPAAADYAAKKKECDDQEALYLKNALSGFIQARESENFPVCGMDETTLDFLIAGLAAIQQQYDIANKMLGPIISNTAINPRVRDKARDMREDIAAKAKAAKEAAEQGA